MTSANLIAWLSFDETTTKDFCGNSWTATDDSLEIEDSTARARRGTCLMINSFSRGSYLYKNGGITLGGRDFTVPFWSKQFFDGAHQLFSLNQGDLANAIELRTNHDPDEVYLTCFGTTYSATASLNLNHWELDYLHSAGQLLLFVDGSLLLTINATIPATNFTNCWIGQSCDSSVDFNPVWLDEFMIYDGTALHSANFTPPTAADYDDLQLDVAGLTVTYEADLELTINNSLYVESFSYQADLALKITNPALEWEYYGVDEIAMSRVTILNDLPPGQSLDGKGFYCTAQNQTFNVPNVHDIVMDFDMYSDWTKDWRAMNYKYPSEPRCGVRWVNGDKTINLYLNGDVIRSVGVNLKKNQLYSCRLHLSSGAASGVIEFSINGVLIVRAEGDVNSGNPFSTLFLQCDNGNVIFSSLYIAGYKYPDWFKVIGQGDLRLDVRNSAYVQQVIARDDVTAWLSCLYEVTEDYLPNRWTANSDTLKISAAQEDDNHSSALYIGGYEGTVNGQLSLACSGLYLGGKDFAITFDWWYGGARSLATNYPFAVFDDNYTGAGSIKLCVNERMSPNQQRLWLDAFDNTTPDFRFEYRSWHTVRIEYVHANSLIALYFDGEDKGSINVTIPKTFFSHVEIDHAMGEAQHGSGYISELKIMGGEMSDDCANKKIYLAVRRNGGVVLYPFRAYEVVGNNAVSIRHDDKNWYSVLRDNTDSLASDYYLKFNGGIVALSN